MISLGRTQRRPPPVAPPFMPNTGPSDGSRSVATALRPDRSQPLGQADRVHRLAFAAGGGRDGRHQDQLAPGRTGRFGKQFQPQFGGVLTVVFQVVVWDAELVRNFADQQEFGRLGRRPGWEFG